MAENTISETVSTAITQALAPIMEENEALREANAQVQAMFNYEDAGWKALLGGASDTEYGLSLDEVKAVSEKASTQIMAGAIPKRAIDLHHGFVFGSGTGMEIEGVEREKGKRGAPSALAKFYESVTNQESIFSGESQHELQAERFVSGNVIVLCDTVKKEVRRVPFTEITNVMTNPDFNEDIWAYMRTWTHTNQSGKSEEKKAWVYTNRHAGPKQKSISVDGKPIPVLQGVVAVDLRANRQVGFTFGIPDAAAGLLWSEAYGRVLKYGQEVNETLAKVVYKVTQTTQKGANNVGVKMGRGGAGQTAALGQGQDIQLVNSAQTSFNFAAARPLAAMAATAWNVSVVDLLSDSSAAGSSYGAGNLLTAGMQNAMNSMRQGWARFYHEIFELMGFGTPTITWPPMNEEDPYRKAQELTLYSVALTDEEYRTEVLDRLNIPGNPKEIPPMLKARGESPKQAASPDQGKSNSTGGQDSGAKNDQRTDTIESLRSEMVMADMLTEVRSLVAQVQELKG